MRCDKHKIAIIFFVCTCDLTLEFYFYTHLFTDEALPNCTRDALDSHKHQGGDAIKPESH